MQLKISFLKLKTFFIDTMYSLDTGYFTASFLSLYPEIKTIESNHYFFDVYPTWLFCISLHAPPSLSSFVIFLAFMCAIYYYPNIGHNQKSTQKVVI